MRNLFIAIWTHSCMVLAAAMFPWYLEEYGGRCSRGSKEMDFKETISISEFLDLERRIIETLKLKKGSGMKSVLDIVAAQLKGYDIKFSRIRAFWFDSINKPHHATIRRIRHKKKRTTEKDYEASIRAALDRVRKTAISLGVKPPFLTSSYMLIETIDGLPMDYYKDDDLYDLIGTQLWNKSPLSRVLYDVIEHTITQRGVSEYKVIPRPRERDEETFIDVRITEALDGGG